MSSFPIPLNSAETILRSEENCIFIKNSPLGVGYNLVYGTLWLTSQRVVFHAGFSGANEIYPLSRLANAASAEVNVARKNLDIGIYQNYTSFNSGLRLDFDNNGLVYFIPKDIDSWAAAVLAAKGGAPWRERDKVEI